jgi:hypothetical protein
MEYKLKPKSPKIRAANFEQEKDLMLMKYQGIFKHNIKEYAEKVIPKLKNKTNYAR